MNAKTVAHDIQAAIRSIAAVDVKRSHIHELIAAAFGCGSHAAMLTRGVLCRMPSSLCKRLRLDEPSIRARASELGYPRPVAHGSCQLVIEALEKHQLRLLPLDVVLGALLNGQTELYAGDLDPVEEEAESDPFPQDFQDDDEWLEKRQEEMDSVADLESEEVISALTEAIDRRDGRAHLAMAILLEGDLVS